jgi:hypothetical protein
MGSALESAVRAAQFKRVYARPALPRGLENLPEPQELSRAVHAWLRVEGSDVLGASRIRPSFLRRCYLSTLYTLDVDGHLALLSIKQYGGARERAQREATVLACLAGTMAPRLFYCDPANAPLGPFLITEFVRRHDELHEKSRSQSIEHAATILAQVHLNTRLMTLCSQTPANAFLINWCRSVDLVNGLSDETLRGELQRLFQSLEKWIGRWESLFDDGVNAYVHGDLPHGHLYRTARGNVITHWEFSNDDHPSRELGRTANLLGLTGDEVALLLERYNSEVPWSITIQQVQVARLMEAIYEVSHMAYWLDCWGASILPERSREVTNRAQVLCSVLAYEAHPACSIGQ